MGMMLRTLIRFEGRLLKRSFDSLTKTPQSAQRQYLLKVIEENAETEYGKKYRFDTIKDERDYHKQVPIITYQDLEPFINRILAGEQSILTSVRPFMFNVTSGTTDKPKYIPVTERTKQRTARLMNQWLYRCLLDHPDFLDGCSFTITSSAIEGQVLCGLPYGSASGLMYRNLPRIMHKSYVLPFSVGDIKNYDLRYYAMSRLSIEKDVTVVATPNPTTLKRIAETGMRLQEAIIRSISEGKLFSGMDFAMDRHDSEIVASINSRLKPNRTRARFLEEVMRMKGKLQPCDYWPSLKMIGCWLGGSVGYLADRLSEYYGPVPKRDLGYMASEGSVTLPYEDETPSGILALPNNFYEFIPEEEISNPEPQVLLAHQLEPGKQYKVILTNESGLYRYDLNDTVKVEKYYDNTPVLSFVRKTSDMLNMTGEKLHVNQLIFALKKTGREFQLPISQFRVVSNMQEMRYDILAAFARGIACSKVNGSFVKAIDRCLGEVNIEYAQKRGSKRLNAPCLHIMDPLWEECVKRALIESGKRDIQYKWRPMASEFIEQDRPYITCSIILSE